MNVEYQPGTQPEELKLWGVLSDLAARPLTKDEFGLLLWRATLLGMDELLDRESLNSFLSLWEFTPDSYPIGKALPTRRHTTNQESEFEEKLQLWRTAISYIQADLAADKLRLSYSTIESMRKDRANAAILASVSFKRALIRSVLQSLTPQEFEQLCYLCIQRDDRFSSVTHPGSTGSDQGIDILAVHRISCKPWIFQCKRLTKYSAAAFTLEIDKLKANGHKCDKLVFLTSQEIPAAIIRKVLQYGGEHEFDAIEFWGPVNLVAMLFSNPTPFMDLIGDQSPQVVDLAARLTRLENAMLKDSPARELTRALAKEMKSAVDSQSKLSRKVQLTAGAALVLFLVREATEVIESLRNPLTRLARDRKALDRLAKKTEARFQKYREQLRHFDEGRLQGLEALKREFWRKITGEDLVLAETVDKVLEMDLQDPVLTATMIAALRQIPDIVNIAWTEFLNLIKLNIIQLFESRGPNSVATFLFGDHSRCSACKTRLQYEQIGSMLLIARDGTYRAVSTKALVCYKCGQVELRELVIRYVDAIDESC